MSFILLGPPKSPYIRLENELHCLWKTGNKVSLPFGSASKDFFDLHLADLWTGAVQAPSMEAGLLDHPLEATIQKIDSIFQTAMEKYRADLTAASKKELEPNFLKLLFFGGLLGAFFGEALNRATPLRELEETYEVSQGRTIMFAIIGAYRGVFFASLFCNQFKARLKCIENIGHAEESRKKEMILLVQKAQSDLSEASIVENEKNLKQLDQFLGYFLQHIKEN